MSGRRLMIVDDSMVIRRRIARLSADERCRVCVVALAADGHQAVQQAHRGRNCQPDVRLRAPAFGEAMEISPPQVLTQRQKHHIEAGIETVPFVIPMAWDGYQAHLVVRMAPGS